MNEALTGTSNTMVPDLLQFEFALTDLATFIPFTDAARAKVLAQSSALPSLIFRPGGLPPMA
ncbi:TPA: hypothetical protein ACNH4I_003432 [Serratia marcescens]|uniref:hypothetical protein n=1 Tax=Enterobacter cloacae complex TaxID=354276 RepID=UPI001C20C653|nr:hypothetical protein [Enterobacter cloacae complex sp.]